MSLWHDLITLIAMVIGVGHLVASYWWRARGDYERATFHMATCAAFCALAAIRTHS